MDLLPETEQIHFMKIGLYGLSRSCVSNIKDLEKIPYELINDRNFIKQTFWFPRQEKKLVYRDIVTGEVYTFEDRDAVWNEEGLKHKLLH